jgi:hypothetical protein
MRNLLALLAALALLAFSAGVAEAHGPCDCLFPVVGEPGASVNVASGGRVLRRRLNWPAYKVIFNPKPSAYGEAGSTSGYASAYQEEARTVTVFSRSRKHPGSGSTVPCATFGKTGALLGHDLRWQRRRSALHMGLLSRARTRSPAVQRDRTGCGWRLGHRPGSARRGSGDPRHWGACLVKATSEALRIGPLLRKRADNYVMTRWRGAALAVVLIGASLVAVRLPGAASSEAVACHVTKPNGSTAPGERPSDTHHGKRGLWTVLPQDGVLLISMTRPPPPGTTGGTIHADGSLSTKFPWWGSRLAASKLKIRGRRLDAPARRLRLMVGPGATARSPHFWATRLRFASSGCWRVTARSGRARLRFTIAVRSAAD